MKFKQFFIGTLIGSASCLAVAQPDWRYTESYNGYDVFVDINSIVPINEYGKATHKAWTKYFVDEDKVQDGLAVGDYFVSLDWIHCGYKTAGDKSITTYKRQKNGMMDNKTVSVPYVEMEDVIPGSVGEKVVETICSNI